MKVWFLSAVVAGHVLPLCYTFTETEMFNYLEKCDVMYRLYQEGHLWLEQIEIEHVLNCVSAEWYFKMYAEG